MMEIRHATVQDLDAMMEIYAYAREFMAATGNAKQWGATNWPPKLLIEKDIENGDSYLCVDSEKILAVFYYKYGKDIDPCYLQIEGGAWLDDSPYGVIHRIASAKGTKGAGTFCINWAFEQCGHLRIDTHGDNIVLQNLLKKLGFTYCGVIHIVEDNDPRLAFEKTNLTDEVES